jgi:hypothetical protein
MRREALVLVGGVLLDAAAGDPRRWHPAAGLGAGGRAIGGPDDLRATARPGALDVLVPALRERGG